MNPVDKIILGAIAVCALVVVGCLGSIVIDRVRGRRRINEIIASARREVRP